MRWGTVCSQVWNHMQYLARKMASLQSGHAYTPSASLNESVRYSAQSLQADAGTVRRYPPLLSASQSAASCVTSLYERSKLNSMVWVRERTIPTERPPLVGEVSTNFWGSRVPRGQRDGSLRPYSRISRPEPLLFVPSSSSVVLTRLSGPRSRPTTF
jgi:hypothetical protein